MNKVCLVTGAKKGIGFAVSQKLASARPINNYTKQ